MLSTFVDFRQYKIVPALLMALVFWALAHQGLQSVWSYYTMLKFEWSELAVGVSLAGLGLAVAVAQGGLTRLLIPRWGERKAATVGMCCVFVSYLVYATAPYGWVMYLGISIFTFGGLVMPSLQALMSRAVPADVQGGLQGAVASTVGLAAIIGPIVMTSLFQHFADPKAAFWFPGAPFVAAAALTIVSLSVLRAVTRPRPAADGG